MRQFNIYEAIHEAKTNLSRIVERVEHGDHAIVATRLPMIHRDPSDRMLVAQAQCAGFTIAARGADIRKYDASVPPV